MTKVPNTPTLILGKTHRVHPCRFLAKDKYHWDGKISFHSNIRLRHKFSESWHIRKRTVPNPALWEDLSWATFIPPNFFFSSTNLSKKEGKLSKRRANISPCSALMTSTKGARAKEPRSWVTQGTLTENQGLTPRNAGISSKKALGAKMLRKSDPVSGEREDVSHAQSGLCGHSVRHQLMDATPSRGENGHLGYERIVSRYSTYHSSVLVWKKLRKQKISCMSNIE